MHEVMGTSSYTTSFRRARVGLGNTEPRYNSHVEGVKKKYYINSTYPIFDAVATVKKLLSG